MLRGRWIARRAGSRAGHDRLHGDAGGRVQASDIDEELVLSMLVPRISNTFRKRAAGGWCSRNRQGVSSPNHVESGDLV